MVVKKFLRVNVNQYSKLGVRRKKLRKYRKGIGLDNKIRLKMKGHLRNVSIGFRNEKKTRDLVNGLKPVRIENLKELEKLGKDQIGIIGKVGMKKKKEIIDYATKNNLTISLSPKTTINKIEAKIRSAKDKKLKRTQKRLLKDKKAKDKAEKEAKKAEKDKADAEKKEADKEAKKDTEEKKAVKQETKGVKPVENKKQMKTNNYGRGK